MRRLACVLGFVVALLLPYRSAAETLLEKLLRVTGLTAAPTQLRGAATEVMIGNVWIVEAGGKGARPLTTTGGHRSPVFDPTGRSIFALDGEHVVEISLGGGASSVVHGQLRGAVKLVGFDAKNAAEIIVLTDDPKVPLWVFAMASGKVTPVPYRATSQEERRMLAQIRGEERSVGTTAVYVKREQKPGLSRPIEWTEVYVKRNEGAPLNLSRCDGVNCGEPALSPDGLHVAFIRTE